MPTTAKQPTEAPTACAGPDSSPSNGSASSCANCTGCKYQTMPADGGWCYMFRESPDEWPCAQHDLYAPTRRITKLSTVAMLSAIASLNPAD